MALITYGNLHLAIKNNNIDLLKKFIDPHYGCCNYNTFVKCGCHKNITLLEEVILHDKINCMELILSGKTTKELYEIFLKFIPYSVQFGSIMCMRVMLGFIKNIITHDIYHEFHSYCDRLLFIAVKYNNITSFETLLSMGANINIKDNLSNNLLHYAVRNPEYNINTLIDKGIDINGQNTDGNTPIMISVKSNYNHTYALINIGADLNIHNNLGQNALHIVIKYIVDTYKINKLDRMGDITCYCDTRNAIKMLTELIKHINTMIDDESFAIVKDYMKKNGKMHDQILEFDNYVAKNIINLKPAKDK